MRKCWTKAGLKPSRANFKSCSSMSHVRGLRYLRLASFATCRTLLSLGLVPLTVCSSSCLESNGCGTSNILGSWEKSRPHFNSFSGLYGPPFRDSPATCLSSASFLNQGRGFHNPFLSVSFGTLKPKPFGWCRHILLPAWAGFWPSPWVTVA